MKLKEKGQECVDWVCFAANGTLKLKEAGSSETLVTSCCVRRRHIKKAYNLQI